MSSIGKDSAFQDLNVEISQDFASIALALLSSQPSFHVALPIIGHVTCHIISKPKVYETSSLGAEKVSFVEKWSVSLSSNKD